MFQLSPFISSKVAFDLTSCPAAIGAKHLVSALGDEFLISDRFNPANHDLDRILEDIVDGRKSFPSGHSSSAFSGMTFLFLWLAGSTAAWSFSTALPPRNPWIFSSRLGRMLVTMLPLVYATWVAISRVEDYVSHLTGPASTSKSLVRGIIKKMSSLAVLSVYSAGL